MNNDPREPYSFSCFDDRPDNDGLGGNWPEPRDEEENWEYIDADNDSYLEDEE